MLRHRSDSKVYIFLVIHLVYKQNIMCLLFEFIFKILVLSDCSVFWFSDGHVTCHCVRV